LAGQIRQAEIKKEKRSSNITHMKNWVFDLDGTLVDSFAHYFGTLEEIFAAHGSRFVPDLRQAALTDPLDLFFEKHIGPTAVPPAFEMLRLLSNESARHILPFAGIEKVVRELKRRGARVAVWTNRDLESATLILKHSGLKPLAELCVSGTCVDLRKPHPEGLLRLIQHFGCAPSDVTMVGDHEHDVTAANEAGVRAVRASWHAYWKIDACPDADFQFHSVPDFENWAAGLGKS
jgi:HAD superfamily hydrolase (TIGR01549 family)